MGRMAKIRGHLHNWHATDDLRVMEPAYVSTVDSGNLAGHLIAVAQACAQWQRTPVAEADWRAGLSDTLHLARRALGAAEEPADPALADLLSELDAAASRHAPLHRLLQLSGAAIDRARAVAPPTPRSASGSGR